MNFRKSECVQISSRRKIRICRFVVVAVFLSSCGVAETTTNRDRNVGGDNPIYESPYDNYSVEAYQRAVSRPLDRGYETPITSGSWDPRHYDTGGTAARAQLASPRVDQLSPPPIPDRPSLRTGGGATASPSKTLKTPSGSTYKTGAIAKSLGGLGNAGAMVGASLASAGIGMALDALGAPPFLTSLFGGGGDAATAAALVQIQKTLEEINQKLDAALEKIDSLQQSVNELTAAVQNLAQNTCRDSATATWNSMRSKATAVEETWRNIFIDNPLIDSSTSVAALTATQRSDLARLAAKTLTLSPLQLITTLTEDFVGNASFDQTTSSTSGLLFQVQKCTLISKRFLTNKDTSDWQRLGVLVMTMMSHAAQIAIFDEFYKSVVTPDRLPDLRQINMINAVLRQATAIIGFHTSMQIPEGQVLDTVTNKMWRLAPTASGSPESVSLIDALKSCLPDEDLLTNYAPLASWSGFETHNLSKCVATAEEARNLTGKPLDMSPYSKAESRRITDASAWRIPIGAEFTRAEANFGSVAKDATPGLLDGGVNNAGGTFAEWSTATCGSGNAKCPTPGDYLTRFGSANVFDGLGIVWTNTSMAVVGSAGSLTTDGRRNWTTEGTFHNGAYGAFNQGSVRFDNDQIYGWSEDGEPQYFGYSGALRRYTIFRGNIYQNNGMVPNLKSLLRISNERRVRDFPAMFNDAWWTDVQRDNFCFRVTNNITKGAPRNDWYTPYFAEVAVLNFGPSTSAPRALITVNGSKVDASQPDNYLPTAPGKVAAYYANRFGASSALIGCAHDWYATTVVDLPETAQSVWVRDLAPREIYYSVGGTTGPTPIGDMRLLQRELEPPMVSILTMGGRASIVTLQARSVSDRGAIVKCLVDDPVEPVRPDEVLARGMDCPAYEFDLPNGLHDVWAVASRQRSIPATKQVVAVTSPIERANALIYGTALPELIPEAPTSPSLPTTTTQPTNLELTVAQQTPATTTTQPTNLELTVAKQTPATTTPPSPTAPNSIEPADSPVAPDVAQEPTIAQVAQAMTARDAGGIDTGSLLRKLNVTSRPGDRVEVTVTPQSRSICRYVVPHVVPLKRGRCRVSVKITTRRGSRDQKTITLNVG
ncbi:MAG: hypothetical protein KJS66_01470 [Acidobacteria bacterium]|nr:hypothetical protein [Acidobacteriota bacterium]